MLDIPFQRLLKKGILLASNATTLWSTLYLSFPIDIFDRMINTGSKEPFTEEELKMYKDIEKMTQGSTKLKQEGQPKCHNMFLQYGWKNKEVPFTKGID
jgi:hypothetical protein